MTGVPSPMTMWALLWPDGLEIMVNVDAFSGDKRKRVKTHVGNGGLSLRRNAACVRLLNEFPQATQMFVQTGSSEDIFFAIMGSRSTDFLMPNERVVSHFALELRPEYYYAVNDNLAHGWACLVALQPGLWETLLEEAPRAVGRYAVRPPAMPAIEAAHI